MTIGVFWSPILVLIEVARRWRVRRLEAKLALPSTTRRTDPAAV